MAFDFLEFLKNGFVVEDTTKDKVYWGTLASEGDLKVRSLSFYMAKLDTWSSGDYIIATREEFLEYLDAQFQEFKPQEFKLNRISQTDDQFVHDMQYALDLIKQQELQKLINVTYANYEISGHPLLRWKEWAKLNGAFYGVWGNDEGFLGVSPEILLSKEERNVETVALAGTRKLEEGDLEDFLNDPKEREEHNFVINDIFQKLEDKGIEPKCGETRVFSYGPFGHLKTKISFNTDLSGPEIARFLSPTAALGTFPANRLNILKNMKYYQFEKEARHFGGAFGIELGDDALFIVCIRNIYWSGTSAVIHSGCGVVADSIIENELNEVQAKRKSVESVLGAEE